MRSRTSATTAVAQKQTSVRYLRSTNTAAIAMALHWQACLQARECMQNSWMGSSGDIWETMSCSQDHSGEIPASIVKLQGFASRFLAAQVRRMCLPTWAVGSKPRPCRLVYGAQGARESSIWRWSPARESVAGAYEVHRGSILLVWI